MTKTLNHVDLCFVIDTTGSMGGFIQEAKQQLLDTIRLLSADSDIDLQVGLVEYRDHPPQDTTFVTRIYPLTANLQEMQKNINKLEADGGGDHPEAVYDGVLDAANQMKWRRNSCRFILLVGDAPPHGFQADRDSDGFTHTDSARYPNGLTVQWVTAAAENQRVTVHALCMGGDRSCVQSFTANRQGRRFAIATGTGGQCASVRDAKDVICQIVTMLKGEFRDLEFDRKVLQNVQRLGNLDISATADALGCPRLQVASAIARLGKRGFLEF
ncbi:VWA domain-containing protein [Coleofasciculus sp. H7-2]|uniref:vWA domain-containing protein n=1 Tax=Coleofasciculus sp. H7-2 TaxID=3351545 RepID=UPI00366C2E08